MMAVMMVVLLVCLSVQWMLSLWKISPLILVHEILELIVGLWESILGETLGLMPVK